MSQTTKPSVRSLRIAGAAGLAAAACALASLAGASPASAAFTSPLCGGSPITGEGASFQANAQNAVFRPYFQNTLCSSVAAPPSITYNGKSSGEGRAALGANATGARSLVSRFAGSDEPLSPATKNQINNGLPTAGDEGQIHQIPVALGAIVPLVNFPNGCDVNTVPTVNQTNPIPTQNPPTLNYTNRVRFTKAQFEAVLNGGTDADTWGDLFPDLAAIAGNTAGPGGAAKSDADCRGQQITRVVRFDESGSTFALKDALNKFNPSRGWPQFNSSDNRLWPNADRDAGAYCASQGFPNAGASSVGPNGSNGTPTLVTGCGSGGSSLVTKFNQTDGAVSYVDLSTAVTSGLRITPTTNAAARDDDRYLTQLPNGTAGDATFVEPTLQPGGFASDANTGGANCGSFTTISNVPSSTLGDWSGVTATNSPSGWGICTLTYDLAFDDNAKAFPTADASAFVAEEKQARTVRDYLFGAVSDVAQASLPAYNYAAVPPAIRTIAQQGAGQIDWNKSGTGGGGGGGGPITQPGPPAGNAPAAPPAGQPLVAAPSNRFSVPRVSLSSKSGSATFSVLTPGAGRIVVASTASVTTRKGKKKTTKKVKLGTITRTVSKGGTVKLTLKPTGSVLSALKKAKSLKVSVKITFTPQGGSARSSSRTITLKYKAPAKKKASKKR